MPILINASSNASSVSEIIRKYGQDFPKDVAIALSKTARGAKDDLVEKLPEYIDRPTPWTKLGFKFKGATDSKLEAVVLTKEPNELYRGQHHMEVQVYGGDNRALKGSERRMRVKGYLSANEFIAPGPAAHLDQYGNLDGKKMVQLLSQIRSLSNKGQDGFEGNRAEGAKSTAFFATINGHKGIWERRGKRNIRLMASAITAPKYTPRFPMTELVNEYVQSNFELIFWQEYAKGKEKRASKGL